MQIRDVMTKGCTYCEATDGITSIARKMAADDIGVMPVAKDNRMIGMVTDRDLVVRGLAVQDEVSSLKARDVMTDAVYYCFDDQDCAEVARNMGEMQVRRMPVVTREKELVGLVSLGDLATGGETKAAAEALHGVSKH